MDISRFNLEQFLHSGSIFSNGEKIIAFWGEKTKEKRIYQGDYFDPYKGNWSGFECQQVFHKEQFQNLFQDQISDGVIWHQPYGEHFKHLFEELKELIHSNQLTKGVPYTVETSNKKMVPSRLASSLKALIRYSSKYPVFLYGLWDEHHGILGGTPEILFQMDDLELNTMACGGTFSETATEKEYEEHQWIIDGICESLSPIGIIDKSETAIRPFSHFNHLITPIKVKLKSNIPFEEIVEILHPTPALGTYPKKEGVKWLRSYQTKIPRKYFGAPFAIKEGRHSYACYVAIRNVQWDENGMEIAAGCGVTAKSTFSKEWNEIQWKLKQIKSMLAL